MGCEAALRTLSYHLARVLVLTQPEKGRVPQMEIRCPFPNADLCDESRLQPAAKLHCFSGQREPAPCIGRPRQVGERAFPGPKPFKSSEYRSSLPASLNPFRILPEKSACRLGNSPRAGHQRMQLQRRGIRRPRKSSCVLD